MQMLYLLALAAGCAAQPVAPEGPQGYVWTIDGVPIIPSVAVREGDANDVRAWKAAVAANGEGTLPSAASFTTPWDPTRITVPLAMGRDSVTNVANGGVVFTVTGHSFPFNAASGSAFWERRPVFTLRPCADSNNNVDYGPRGRVNAPAGQSLALDQRQPCTCADSNLIQQVGGTIALQVIPTSETTGTLALSPAQITTILTGAAAGGVAGSIAAGEGMESDWILCGQSETRRHTHPILSALDLLNDGDAACVAGAQPCEVPPARGRYVAGFDSGAAGLWNEATLGADPLNVITDPNDINVFNVANGVVLQFRRSCVSDLQCIQRAEDGNPSTDQDRENYINVRDGRYRRTCSAVPPGPTGQARGSICVNSEVNAWCGQALFDKLAEKCCSSDSQTGAGHVFPTERANKQLGQPFGWERDPWTCPCSAGDGVNALAAANVVAGNTDGFDLGATVTCGRDGEACCTYTKYSGLVNAAPVAEVNPNFLDLATQPFADFLCPAGTDAADTLGAAAGDVPADIVARVGCGASAYGLNWNGVGPFVAASSASALTNADLYKFGSVTYPFYSCYNTQYQSCCDDGTVYDPATAQCCPVTGVQPASNPCPCVDDGDCTAGKTCCTQTSPPPVREGYLDAMCSQYANHYGTGTDLRQGYATASGSSLGGLLSSSVPLTDRLYAKLIAARDPGAAAGTGLGPAGLYPAGMDTHFLHPADERVRQKTARRPGALNVGDIGDLIAPGFHGGVCPGKCIDPAWQLCCNGAVCHESYETCCNTTCCNKKSQTCVTGGQLTADGHGVQTNLDALGPLLYAAERFLKASDIIQGYENSALIYTDPAQDPVNAYLANQGRSLWTWTANNLGNQYDMCTEIEYLSATKAFWVFVLPTFLLTFTLVAVFVVAAFVNGEAQKNGGEGFDFYTKWVLALATLMGAFALPTFFSPQWVYGLVVVLAALFGLVAFASRNAYLRTVFVAVNLVTLLYLIDPLAGNQYLDLTASGQIGLVPAVLSNWNTYDRYNELDTPKEVFGLGESYGFIDDDCGWSQTCAPDFAGGPQTNLPGRLVSPWYKLFSANRNVIANGGDCIDSQPSTPGDACFRNHVEVRDFAGGRTHLTTNLGSGELPPMSNGWNQAENAANTPGLGQSSGRDLGQGRRETNGFFWSDPNTPAGFGQAGAISSPKNPWAAQDSATAANPFRSACTQYYDYFELDARLLDLDRQANHDERFFGYCSRGWTVFLAICAGLVIMLGLVLFVMVILTIVLAAIESSTPSKSSAFVHGPLPEVPAIYAQ